MAKENKRYYYLKISETFFTDKAIKRLRRLPGGDTFTCIYLKMLLASLETDGYMVYEGVESTAIEEIALDLDEDVEAVEVTLNYLISKGLATIENENVYLNRVNELSGSETASTRRSRKCRALKSNEVKALQCNTGATQVQQKEEALHCNTNATLLQHDATKGNPILEIELEKELEKELDIEKDGKNLIATIEDAFMRPLSTNEMQRILCLSDEYDERRVICALNEAVVYEKLNLNYIERILQKWKEKGLSVESIENGER